MQYASSSPSNPQIQRGEVKGNYNKAPSSRNSLSADPRRTPYGISPWPLQKNDYRQRQERVQSRMKQQQQQQDKNSKDHLMDAKMIKKLKDWMTNYTSRLIMIRE